MESILVIGTQPPCPRCDQLLRLVREAVGSGSEVSVSHCSFDAPLATELGLRLNRKMGTAKHVAQHAGIEIDWSRVYELMQSTSTAGLEPLRPAHAWSPELDALLKPCSDKADEFGYFMTPILVVDGRVLHHGSVPSGELLTQLLKLH